MSYVPTTSHSDLLLQRPRIVDNEDARRQSRSMVTVARLAGTVLRILVLGHLLTIALLGLYAVWTNARVFRYMGF